MLDDKLLPASGAGAAAQAFSQADSTIERLQNLQKNLDGLPPEQRLQRIRQAAQEFEGILLQQMLKVMRESMISDKDSLYGGSGLNADMYMGFFEGEVAKEIASDGEGLGLGRMVYEQLAGQVAKPENKGEGGVTPPLHALHGRVTSGFGLRTDPLTGQLREHDGIDLGERSGTWVRPISDGTVRFSGREGGYGNLVCVRHADGTETRYAHLKDIFVKEGQHVGQDTIIGTVGSTGRSTGPHLHFELRAKDGRALDPTGLLDKTV